MKPVETNLRKDWLDPEYQEPRVLRPILRHHDVDSTEDEVFENGYDGSIKDIINENPFALNSFIDELEDRDNFGDSLEFIPRRSTYRKKIK